MGTQFKRGVNGGARVNARLSAGAFIRGAIFALVGAVAGRLAAPQVLMLFDEAPAWIAPAVIIGTVALFLTAFLLIPQLRRGKK